MHAGPIIANLHLIEEIFLHFFCVVEMRLLGQNKFVWQWKSIENEIFSVDFPVGLD